MASPTCLLLLPRSLEGFILRDQAKELLKRPGVKAIGPRRVPYGISGRLPSPLANAVAARQAARIVRKQNVTGEGVRVVVFFHPFQLPLAQAIAAVAGAGCELWYGRWDRYEEAYDAGPRLRTRIARLHERASTASALTFVASDELERQEREAGRSAEVVGLAADSFPDPAPLGPVIAVSLGHLGWRTDWALLRAVAEQMDELVLLLIGEWHDRECSHDDDYRWCRHHPAFVWLGGRSDEDAARLILCADVGIVPFRDEPFNRAGLPYRILKYARLGRRTVSPDLPGVRTWSQAVTTCSGPDEFVAALRAEAGRRLHGHPELREWAMRQTAASVNEPLHERLNALGIG